MTIFRHFALAALALCAASCTQVQDLGWRTYDLVADDLLVDLAAPDLAAALDLTVPPDLRVDDAAVSADLAVPPDLVMAPDFAGVDLRIPPDAATVDLTPGPDLSCMQFFQLCGNQCVYTNFDPAHCGGCNQPCLDNARCMTGVCMACGSVPYITGDGGIAQVPLVSCKNECVNTLEDIRHCGRCGNQCAPSSRCALGVCQACANPSDIGCNSRCVDRLTDRFNCGGCARLCPMPRNCVMGVCQ